MTISKPQVATPFDDAQALAVRGQADEALDLIYDRVDQMMHAGQFEELDANID